MTPERASRLAIWLRGLAETEEQTAAVLEKLGTIADPRHCRDKARLFREIADHLIHSPARAPPDEGHGPADAGRPPEPVQADDGGGAVAPIRAFL